MPQLKWDETEFLECLEVTPEIDEYEVQHMYEVEQHGLVLTATVWQYESVICLSLRQQAMNEPLVEFTLFVRDGIRYVKDKRGEYLEFQDCIVAPSRFSYIEIGDVFDKTKFDHGLTLQLATKPHLQIRPIRK